MTFEQVFDTVIWLFIIPKLLAISNQLEHLNGDQNLSVEFSTLSIQKHFSFKWANSSKDSEVAR